MGADAKRRETRKRRFNIGKSVFSYNSNNNIRDDEAIIGESPKQEHEQRRSKSETTMSPTVEAGSTSEAICDARRVIAPKSQRFIVFIGLFAELSTWLDLTLPHRKPALYSHG